jgi:hypothetical protein
MQVTKEELFSRFKPYHTQAVKSLVAMVLGQATFDSLLSFLALSKEVCNRQVGLTVESLLC